MVLSDQVFQIAVVKGIVFNIGGHLMVFMNSKFSAWYGFGHVV